MPNYYDLGVNDAFAKFAVLSVNPHGVPNIPPVARPAAPAGQVPNPAHAIGAVTAPPPPTMAWKAEPTAPVQGSQPMPNDQALFQQLGSSVAGGLNMPSKGRNVFASLKPHFI